MRKLLVPAMLWLAGAAQAAPTVDAESVRPFLTQYCGQCHGPKLAMADRRFDTLSADLSDPDAQQGWQEIVDRLNLGEMPPKGSAQPSPEERQRVVDRLTETLLAASAEHKRSGGRTVLRRLNRYEYDRSVRQLLRLEGMLEDPTDVFPPDAVEEGFDNIGAALQTSDFLLSGYLEAAAKYIDRAVAEGPQPPARKYAFTAPFHPTFNRHDGQDMPGEYQHIRKNTSDEGGFLWLADFEQGAPQSGYYRLRVKAQAMQRDYPYDESIVGVRKDEPLRMGVVASSAAYGELSLRTSSDRRLMEIELPDDAPRWFETTIWLDQGYQPRLTFPNGPNGVKPLRRPLAVRYPETFPVFIRGFVVEDGPVTAETVDESLTRRVSRQGASKTELTTVGTSRTFNRREGWASFFREYQGPRVRVYEIELDGPLHEQWPPASHKALFGDLEPTPANAAPILRRFATKAFRRPATEQEIAPLVALVERRAAQGDAPLEALKAGLRGVLVSPGFLYLQENEGRLPDYALASRLSYFLWSAPPDEPLLQAAAAGGLQAEGALRAQALRMLRDPRAQALTERFTERWLELYKIGSMPPGMSDFPAYYVDGLEEAMKAETRLFFQNALDENLPLEVFLDADFTFVNGGLARLYGLEGVHGAELRKTALPDRRRGGLLGMASVLTASANGIDTSPVVRGVWVLENILGIQPTPPPPDVEPLEPDIRGATTIRDQLQKHRSIATCNSCHQKFDPLGFALENFDPIGGWRDNYRRPKGPGPRVDASGELPSGEVFDSIMSFKSALVENHTQGFARCVTEKLLAYAMGRTLEPSDRPEVERLVAEQSRPGQGLRDLVLRVAESEAFRTK
ncbi:MAG: DUF1592 domain-containing protein [Acidobacteria bacterium]|nr:DUF1592 domain-containing protein [Acidobacteriota bacterium]